MKAFECFLEKPGEENIIIGQQGKKRGLDAFHAKKKIGHGAYILWMAKVLDSTVCGG